MKQVGIVCEFNPFHKGHEYLIQRVKEAYPQKGIVCMMSSNFVQRGSFAIVDKYSRAKCAVLSGADLVLEIPFPFSCLSAEGYARSAISLLSRIGVCDTLAFGTEAGSGEDLMRCANRLSSESFQAALSTFLENNKGAGYPAAREAVYETLFGKEPLLSQPNASLAVEYLMAMKEFGVLFDLFPLLRRGDGYKAETQSGIFASATTIRSRILSGEGADFLLPRVSADVLAMEQAAGRFPVNMEKLAPALFYLLKTIPQKELSSYYGFSSLCARAVRLADECERIEDLVKEMKNRSFTDSRIRRGLLSVLCRIPRHAEKELPAFTQVLSANEKGREILAQMKETSSVPVFTKPAHALKLDSKTVCRQVSAQILADEIYVMAMPKKQEKGYFLKQKPTIF